MLCSSPGGGTSGHGWAGATAAHWPNGSARTCWPGCTSHNANHPATGFYFYQYSSSWDSGQILLNDKDQQVLIVSCLLWTKSAIYDGLVDIIAAGFYGPRCHYCHPSSSSSRVQMGTTKHPLLLDSDWFLRESAGLLFATTAMLTGQWWHIEDFIIFQFPFFKTYRIEYRASCIYILADFIFTVYGILIPLLYKNTYIRQYEFHRLWMLLQCAAGASVIPGCSEDIMWAWRSASWARCGVDWVAASVTCLITSHWTAAWESLRLRGTARKPSEYSDNTVTTKDWHGIRSHPIPTQFPQIA